MIGRVSVAAAFSIMLGLSGAARAQGVISDWSGVKNPPPPDLKAAIVDPKTTALLLFDFTTQTCSVERRPRCAASIPKMKKLRDDARAHGVLIVYSLAIAGTGRADIIADIAPSDGDPILPPLGPDKFINSDFEKMLRDRGVTTLILTGTAAQSTVLHTGGEAGLRGFKVIVPVDGMSSNEDFAELYTAWHLANTARVKDAVTLTEASMISYKQ